MAGGRILQILSAQKHSAARYTCIATNEVGETMKHYEVQVYSKEMLPMLIAFCILFTVLPVLVYKRISLSYFSKQLHLFLTLL